jgi:large subunit ribosomal protein L24
MRPIRKGTVKSKIKRGDQVVFIAGKEYARYDNNGNRQPLRGKVIAVDSRNGKVKVEGAAIVKKHQKAVPQMGKEGGIVQKKLGLIFPTSRSLIRRPETDAHQS